MNTDLLLNIAVYNDKDYIHYCLLPIQKAFIGMNVSDQYWASKVQFFPTQSLCENH